MHKHLSPFANMLARTLLAAMFVGIFAGGFMVVFPKTSEALTWGGATWRERVQINTSYQDFWNGFPVTYPGLVTKLSNFSQVCPGFNCVPADWGTFHWKEVLCAPGEVLTGTHLWMFSDNVDDEHVNAHCTAVSGATISAGSGWIESPMAIVNAVVNKDALCPGGQVATGIRLFGIEPNVDDEHVDVFCSTISGVSFGGASWSEPEISTRYLPRYAGVKEAMCPAGQAAIGVRWFQFPQKMDDEYVGLLCAPVAPPPPVCGNGVIESGEACDAWNLNGQSCSSLGFTSGSLACNGSCTGFDTSGCISAVPVCTGSIPPNAAAWDAEESTGLSSDTPWTQAASDTGVKCQFRCDAGYGWVGGTCQLSVCSNGANNFPACNTCSPLVWNNATSWCVDPLSVTANPVPPLTFPDRTFSLTYTFPTGSSAGANCQLLDNVGAALTAYAPCTGSITWDTPPTVGSFGYSVRANKPATGETVTSNLVTVTVNNTTPPSITLLHARSTVNPAGAVNISASYLDSGASLYWETAGYISSCTVYRNGVFEANTPSVSGVPQTYSIAAGNITEGTIDYSVTCAGGPGQGTLPSHAYIHVPRLTSLVDMVPGDKLTNTSGTYNFRATGVHTLPATNIRYQFDWNGNGVFDAGDGTTPTSGYVPSGSPQDGWSPGWTSVGVHTVGARVQDVFGALSNWLTVQINAVDPVPILVFIPAAANSMGEQIVDNTKVVSPGFTISNDISSTVNLNVTRVYLSGGDIGDFVIKGCSSPFSLTPGTSRSCDVDFTPSVVGTRQAFVTVEGNNGSDMFTIFGEGINAIDETWDLGRAVVSRSREVTFEFNNLSPFFLAPSITMPPPFTCKNTTWMTDFSSTCGLGQMAGYGRTSVVVRFSPVVAGPVSAQGIVNGGTFNNLPPIELRGVGVPGKFQFCEPGEEGCLTP